jgi:hydroxymethylbilane synthase
VPGKPSLLKLGTRKSALAMAQSQQMADRLMARHPGLTVELVPIVTTGDQTQDRTFGAVGTVGMFTTEIEASIRDGRADFGVHSLKDLPTQDSPGLVIAAVPERATPYDVLITRGDLILDELPDGATVGTGSPRRQAQLLAYRSDLRMIDIRGNIDTRLKRLEEGKYDAIVLAAAGMERLGIQNRATEILPPEIMLPAVGQGCLALQCRADDAATIELLHAIEHRKSRQAAEAERALLAGLGGGCDAPIAALGRSEGRTIHLIGLVASPDGATILRHEASASTPEGVGRKLAAELLSMGAAEFLEGFDDNGA